LGVIEISANKSMFSRNVEETFGAKWRQFNQF